MIMYKRGMKIYKGVMTKMNIIIKQSQIDAIIAGIVNVSPKGRLLNRNV